MLVSSVLFFLRGSDYPEKTLSLLLKGEEVPVPEYFEG